MRDTGIGDEIVTRSTDKRAYCGYTLSFALFACINRHKMYLVALFTFGPPVYSWKYRSNGTLELISPPEREKKMAPVTHPMQLASKDVDFVQD